jgi:hypothetical protein
MRSAVILLFLSVAPVAVRADEFADFRVPPNQFLQWTGSASGSSRWSHQTDGPDHHANGLLQGSLQSALAFWRESDTRSMSILANMSNQGIRVHFKEQVFYPNFGSPVFDVRSDERSERALSEALGLTTTQRWYPGGGPWNLAADLKGSLNDSQAWHDDRSSIDLPLFSIVAGEVRSDHQRYYRSNFNGSVGIGLGRVRNVTGVYEARVLEDRLRASGALSRALGAEARQRLAALMYARGDFDASMDRPASTVWDAIERILRADGALSTPSLSAKDLFTLIEPYLGPSGAFAADPSGLPSSPIFRAFGWNVGVALNGQTGHQSRWYDLAWTDTESDSGIPQPPIEIRTSGQNRSSNDAFSAGISAEYHRPVSMRVQWDAAAQAAVPLRHEDRGLRFGAQAALGWIIADRWMASLAGQHNRNIDKDNNSVTRNDSWSTVVSATAFYFVTDHVALRASAGQMWGKTRSDLYYNYFPGAATFGNSGAIEFGLTYRFAGFARVEGLFPAAPILN